MIKVCFLKVYNYELYCICIFIRSLTKTNSMHEAGIRILECNMHGEQYLDRARARVLETKRRDACENIHAVEGATDHTTINSSGIHEAILDCGMTGTQRDS